MNSRCFWCDTVFIAIGMLAFVLTACNSTAPGPGDDGGGNVGNGNANANGGMSTADDDGTSNDNEGGDGGSGTGQESGACCDDEGVCTVVMQENCAGTFHGPASACASDTCPPPTGACCAADDSCVVTTREECAGAFAGGGTICEDDGVCDISPFTEEAEARGIELLVIHGRGDEAGAGVALVDLDNDRDPDLVALGQVGAGVVGVYENDGRGYFTDRSDSSGIPATTAGRGISAADYDDDGDLDLYISQWLEPNMLLRNDGEFRFTDVTEAAGVGGVGHGAGTAWGDYDGDGWVDLYVTNWEYTDVNFLYHNLGDGSFEEVAAQHGVDSRERSYMAAFIDYDKDHDLDLYLSNDNRRSNCGADLYNRLFQNNGGILHDVSVETGAGICLNSMGIAVGDVDNNLYLDLYFTNLPWGNMILMNQGDGTFMEDGERTGLNTQGHLAWATAAFDYDHDGYEEIFVADQSTPDRFYENNGEFPLVDIAPALGLDDDGESFCIALGDVDGDGDLDMVESIRQTNLKLFINHEGQKRRWVKFRVVGRGHDRFGVGTAVTIRTGETRQIRQLLFGNNFKSQNDAILHFGLHDATTIDEIVVDWPGGATRTLRGYSALQTWTLFPPERLGDANENGDFDEEDRAALTACTGKVRPGCEAFDVDGNGTIDDNDVASLP